MGLIGRLFDEISNDQVSGIGRPSSIWIDSNGDDSIKILVLEEKRNRALTHDLTPKVSDSGILIHVHSTRMTV